VALDTRSNYKKLSSQSPFVLKTLVRAGSRGDGLLRARNPAATAPTVGAAEEQVSETNNTAMDFDGVRAEFPNSFRAFRQEEAAA